jgi:hypothetical protein
VLHFLLQNLPLQNLPPPKLLLLNQRPLKLTSGLPGPTLPRMLPLNPLSLEKATEKTK